MNRVDDTPWLHPAQMLRSHPRAAGIALLLTLGAVTIPVLLAVPGAKQGLQHVDNAVLHFMVRIRNPPITGIALVLNVLGSTLVTFPVRLATSIYLIARRRWWFLATFVIAWVVSEALITVLKVGFDRPRPMGSLVHTSGASFPSGHAVASAVTAMALVFVLVAPGPARRKWELRAIAFTLIMGVSRAYLAAHWLSDAVGGVLIGSAAAVDSAVAVQWVHDRLVIRAARKAPVEPAEAAEEMPKQPGPLEAAAAEDEAET
jgi:undecaprenyl-diphosphatase